MSHGGTGGSRGAPLDATMAREIAQTLQALATPSRLLILSALRDAPCAVGELATSIGMERSAVSQQLRVLRHLGLVVGDRRGQRVVYALHDPHVADLLDQAIFHVEHVRLAAAVPVRRDALPA